MQSTKRLKAAGVDVSLRLTTDARREIAASLAGDGPGMTLTRCSQPTRATIVNQVLKHYVIKHVVLASLSDEALLSF